MLSARAAVLWTAWREADPAPSHDALEAAQANRLHHVRGRCSCASAAIRDRARRLKVLVRASDILVIAFASSVSPPAQHRDRDNLGKRAKYGATRSRFVDLALSTGAVLAKRAELAYCCEAMSSLGLLAASARAAVSLRFAGPLALGGLLLLLRLART